MRQRFFFFFLQLLEFCYRYVTTILDDARMVSGHAKKKVVDVDDVKLAVQVCLLFETCFEILILVQGKSSRPLWLVTRVRFPICIKSVFTELNGLSVTSLVNF